MAAAVLRPNGSRMKRLPSLVGCVDYLAILIFGLEEEFTVGDGENFRNIRQCGAAQQGLLQQALPVRQADEGLRMQFTGNRPQAGACATT